MPDAATIYADGRIQYHGYEKMDSTVRCLTRTHITIHHPGGTYWDNGGEHYVSARFEVMEYESIQPANEEGTYLVRFSRRPGTRVAEFHPMKSEAVHAALGQARSLTEKGIHTNPRSEHAH